MILSPKIEVRVTLLSGFLFGYPGFNACTTPARQIPMMPADTVERVRARTWVRYLDKIPTALICVPCLIDGLHHFSEGRDELSMFDEVVLKEPTALELLS